MNDTDDGDKWLEKLVLDAKLAAVRGETPPYGSKAWQDHMRAKQAASEASLLAAQNKLLAAQETLEAQKTRALFIVFGSILAIGVGVAGVAIFASKPAPVPTVPMSNHSGAAVHAVEPWRDIAWADKMKAAVAARMKDPSSAQFRGAKTYHGSGSPVVCGEVNAKNSYGGYGGFERFVAAGDVIFLESEVVPGGMDTIFAKVCN